MAKKTLAQKKLSDVRRVTLPGGAYEPAPTAIPTNEVSISGLSLDAKSTPDVKASSSSHPFLKKDLLKVGLLAIGAVVLEYLASYAVKHGALSQWGIS